MNSDNTKENFGDGPITLVGCGILAREIRYLTKKNNWPLTLRLADSSLHVNYNKLKRSLEDGLEKSRNRPTAVFYGTCHPLMDTLVADWRTIRTPGQNCVEMLLGQELFTEELKKGAFFLLEDWARRFEYVTGMAFNENLEVTRSIFQMAHTYLLGLRTCCSGDFTDHAEKASKLVELPLRWMDVDLDHLEQTLERTIEQHRNKL